MFPFSLLRRLFRPGHNQNKKPGSSGLPGGTPPLEMEELSHLVVEASLANNLALIKRVLGDPGDLVIREFTLGQGQKISAAVVYIDGLIDRNFLAQNVLRPLMLDARLVEPAQVRGAEVFAFIKERTVTGSEVREGREWAAIFNSLLSGEAALFVDGHPSALVVSARGWEKRGIEEPDTEALVRGPREGFTETLRINTALLRRKIKSPRLRMESLKIGRVTQTDVVLVYLEGICSQALVDEVRSRLKRINVDSVLESGYLEELIEDNPISPFPQIQHSERPDAVAADLLEGRVALVVDGTPFVLTMPATLAQFLQTSEDYYERPHVAILIRLIRLASLIISVSLPSFYIAVSTFHQEMLPTTLAISIAAGKEGVPFPAFVEALIMELAFEVLREAGLRLPRTIGQAVSIVGALVVGQAAVAAGIVSPLMVIIVAMTAITSFAIPSYSTAITMRLLRFPLMALGASLGFFGIMWGFTLVLLHMNSLRSFGEPYLSPLAPLHTPGLKDTVVRAPWWMMYLRPRVGYRDPVRQRKGLKPAPPPYQPEPGQQEGQGQKTRGVPVQDKEGPQRKGPDRPEGKKGS